MWRALYAAIFGAPAPARAAKPISPVVTRNEKFAAEFNAFQNAVKNAGNKPPDIAPPATSAMTWRTGESESVEFVADGVVVMTAGGGTSAGGFLGVVGESHYQDALGRAKRSQPGEDEPVFMATLLREPTNPHDTNAVAVVIEPFGTVGYIAREIARRIAPLIDAAAPVPVRCPAQLRGGSLGKPAIGVVLDAVLATGARLSHIDPTQTDHPPEYYDQLQEYYQRKRANETFFADTRGFEVSEGEEAIRRYRVALQTLRDAETFGAEHHVLSSVSEGGARDVDVRILSRLTTCLIKAGRPAEAILEADRYFADFPLAMTLSGAAAVRKRVEKHRLSQNSENPIRLG